MLDNCRFLQVNIWEYITIELQRKCKEMNTDHSYVQNSSENKARVLRKSTSISRVTTQGVFKPIHVRLKQTKKTRSVN